MKLNHITIQTEAFEKEIEFYQKYVGLTVSRDLRPLGKNIVFLSNATVDTALEIIEKPGASDSGNENISIGKINTQISPDASMSASALNALRREALEIGRASCRERVYGTV